MWRSVWNDAAGDLGSTTGINEGTLLMRLTPCSAVAVEGFSVLNELLVELFVAINEP